MLNLFALIVIASSIGLAALALFREQTLQQRFTELADAPGGGIALFPLMKQPATLDGFDPAHEALLVQLPVDQTENLDANDFATRPAADGRGQELLFRDRVLLHLPDISPQREIDLYVAPIA